MLFNKEFHTHTNAAIKLGGTRQNDHFY